ncbi:hypothetical protein PENSPDRAFT_174709 [Peniophora sp. CONT]|nr:hypothetical protein PENSPDRAFT_174709 [Peniophora sp. CONT]
MNFLDPLADTTAPRYAIESDDEDELNPQLPSQAKRVVDIDVKCDPSPDTTLPLVIATGDAGKVWAAGAPLGQQIGAVFVNGVTVGMVFAVKGEANVVVSEATTTLPVWAMNAYAARVLELFKPSKVSLLDSYPVPMYISNAPQPFSEAPIRYLQTHSLLKPTSGVLEPFTPPNLVQSTSAAFLARLAFTSPSTPASLLLLPSAHMSRPRPADIAPSTSSPHETDDGWPSDMLQEVHTLLVPKAPAWDASKGSVRQKPAARRVLVDVGEGGMYI